MAKDLDKAIRNSRTLSWLFLTKEGVVIVGQAPNVPLYLWAGLGLTSLFMRGQYSVWLLIGSRVALLFWCYLEVFWGVNPFRRIAGSLVAVMVLAFMFRF